MLPLRTGLRFLLLSWIPALVGMTGVGRECLKRRVQRPRPESESAQKDSEESRKTDEALKCWPAT